MINDTRAQAIGITRLFLALGVGAVMFFIVSKVTEPILARAESEGSGEVATNGTAWITEAIDFLPIAFLLISFFGLIAYAVFTREVRQ